MGSKSCHVQCQRITIKDLAAVLEDEKIRGYLFFLYAAQNGHYALKKSQGYQPYYFAFANEGFEFHRKAKCI